MNLRRFLKVAIAAILLAGLFGGAAEASILININKNTQRMTVTVDGIKRYTWKVSTGAAGYGTPSGTYHPFRMEADHYSKEWDDAPMPHSIFFTPRGHAIHGTYQTRRLGSAVSHGCVRLSASNATKLYALVGREGMGNTTITITGGSPFDGTLAPLTTSVKKIVPSVKRHFGDWLEVTR
jgi:lipoprotein-anchoring transpeptidase ErfK/SrfK